MPCLNGECPNVLWTVKPATKAEGTISQQKWDQVLGHTVHFQGDQALSSGKIKHDLPFKCRKHKYCLTRKTWEGCTLRQRNKLTNQKWFYLRR